MTFQVGEGTKAQGREQYGRKQGRRLEEQEVQTVSPVWPELHWVLADKYTVLIAPVNGLWFTSQWAKSRFMELLQFYFHLAVGHGAGLRSLSIARSLRPLSLHGSKPPPARLVFAHLSRPAVRHGNGIIVPTSLGSDIHQGSRCSQELRNSAFWKQRAGTTKPSSTVLSRAEPRTSWRNEASSPCSHVVELEELEEQQSDSTIQT